jgi:predicted N-formylglutamate amidohydrolase
MTVITDWRSPVEVFNAQGASPLVLLCEHASNYVPDAYERLGLTPEDLNRHIAWDLGAAEVTRHLSDALQAPAFLGTYSRLLIDLNRPLTAPDSIVVLSEDTPIPGNKMVSNEERRQRHEMIFNPFHALVSQTLGDRQNRGIATLLVSIHSFTPVYRGQTRHLHAGVLFDAAADLGHLMAKGLEADGLTVGLNAPYETTRETDYAVPIHGDDRGIPAILIEIRNDLIDDASGVTEWTARLAGALRSISAA